MTATLRLTTFGQAAIDELASAVHAAKADDPLTPVTVVVPTERIGVAARRALARQQDEERSGVAGITVLTLRRLAESVGTASLTAGGRQPRTRPVLLSALDWVLADAPGLFELVADHPETARALAEAHDELRLLPDNVVEQVASTTDVAGEVVGIHHAVRARLVGTHYDEVDLMRTAADLVASGAAQVPATVLHLLGEPDPAQRALISALVGRTDVTAIVGLTGDDTTDAAVLDAWQGLVGTAPAPAVDEAVGDVVRAATDADDEVRAVVRDIMAMLADGTPGHRIAVLYGTAEPYARLLAEHLDHAGITYNGRGVRPAAERLLGRAVRAVLDLPRTDFRRDAVTGLIADAPVYWQGDRVPSTKWERLSRRAGVVSDDDWATHLPKLASEREYYAEDATQLAAFVADLKARLRAVDEASSWRAAGDEVLRLWQEVLHGDNVSNLPDEERRAADVIDRLLHSLATLDVVGADYSMTSLRELIDLELDSDLDRVGRAGVGVHVGPVADGVGQNLDAVFVVGLAEGLLPGRPADDPLLPDEVRELTYGVLPTLRRRVDDQHRRLLAALASAPAGTVQQPRRVLSFPRGDLRRGGVRVPSRWLVPTLQVLDGSNVLATEWETAIGTPGVEVIASHTAGLLHGDVPAGDQEWRQRAHAAHCAPADPTVARAQTVRSARRGDDLTRFDGLVGPDSPLGDPTQGVLSPTSLENWFRCPHRYLMQYLLGVREVEDPEHIVEISVLDRGSIIHDALDAFVRSALDSGTAPDFGEPWGADDLDRLDDLIQAEFDEAEAEGKTGLSSLWQATARAMRQDLRQFLDEDNARRATDDLRPLASELAFGIGGRDPVDVDLGDGRTLRIRGSVDRVDESRDGLTVLDYKSGGDYRYRDISADAPTRGGAFLQLPLYAVAARQVLDRPGDAVRVAYWFITRRARFSLRGYPVTDEVLQATQDVLRVAADGIAGGLFPPRPKEHSGSYDCSFCNPDGLGERTSVERFESLLTEPALADLAGVLSGRIGTVGTGEEVAP